MSWFSDWWNGVGIIGTQAKTAAANVYDSLWLNRDSASPGVDDPNVWAGPLAAPKAQPTWDEMPWYSKAWTMVSDVIPGAAADTVGLTQRPGAATVGGTISEAVDSVKSIVTAPSFILIVVAVTIIAALALIVAVKR